MAKTSVLDLQVNPGDTRPIFKQIVDGIRMQVVQGKLITGDKLPSVRGLAMQLTINVNTVAKAYTALTVEGVLESRAGLGIFVAEPRQLLSAQEQEKRLQKALDTFVNDVATLDYSKDEILDRVNMALRKIEKLNKNGAEVQPTSPKNKEAEK